ncbi:LPXTG-motif cell wall anchor domain-containing protein [Amycolatopsis marina]|uniref:LPXTG-motif cell wall anchor domain-containing protein n=1 Tax=Amycolatopsis marina TaxID=490629 RepID=A0A1I1CNH1_9PSEU|nr:LPXTG cell wall anchor domain-containing protein [Amycolatopsis marina]SFB64211.1 LPXTG-motif cell wall anchor domain-containing protein [Amycolatopsis marina]
MPVVRKSSVRAALAVVPMALAVVLGTAGMAHATYDEDPRATVHEGNVDAGQKDACKTAGLEGTPLKAGVLDFTEGTPNVDQYLTITGLGDGVTVSGIVVKGGPGYNVYVPGEKGLSDVPPWTELRSPLNKGGKIPAISHWFACGTVTVPTTSTTTSTTDSSTTTPPESSSTEPPESTSSTSGESSTPASTSTSGVATTTSTPAAVPVENASDNDDLASTGFGSGWLLWVGGLLVLGGAAVLVLLRIRRNA